jgi:hypothetical protein
LARCAVWSISMLPVGPHLHLAPAGHHWKVILSQPGSVTP